MSVTVPLPCPLDLFDRTTLKSCYGMDGWKHRTEFHQIIAPNETPRAEITLSKGLR